MDICNNISKELNINTWQIQNSINLFNEGKTLPFIARYRKEQTGSLTETQLRDLKEKLDYLNRLQERKTEILKSIESQGKLTNELKLSIEEADKLHIVEDLYLPYKKQKKTRADIAIDKGLGDAAKFLKSAKNKDDSYFNQFINAENELNELDDIIKGACDIIAQEISENLRIRDYLREKILSSAYLVSKKTKNDDDKEIYKDYYLFEKQFKHIKHHQILALNRGSKQKILKLAIEWEIEPIDNLCNILKISCDKAYFQELKLAVEDAFNRLLMPSLQNEIFSNLLKLAEKRSMQVFAENLKNLMLQRPLANKIILSIDPGYRTGCKLVVLNEFGDVLDHGVIFIHQDNSKILDAEKLIINLVNKYSINIIAIGNGTASRETQIWIANLIKKHNLSVKYAVVSEAGASVYSASKVSVEEFPNYDVTTRGAISIGRRLQDFMAELVKIPPESIGVGMYQHDLTASVLKSVLEQEVESVVNYVGVNLNTSSKYLLKYISGLNSRTAENIVNYRKENGAFQSRNELKKVKGVGPTVFEQAAGFCRIPNSKETLDSTTIHPDNYVKTYELLDYLKCDVNNIKKRLNTLKISYDEIADQLKISSILAKDIIEALKDKGVDPRDDMPDIILREDLLTFNDLKVGQVVEGKITNVVDFGAFVDIGIKESGLLHKSEIADRFVNEASDFLKVGQQFKFKIIAIDRDRERIGLSLKGIESI
ncbi:MAG: RNA-binding transcriptional accessory protein [Spirochaetota bacterium]|nr:RNA-binding transcriptional accessory protein [Spirochaetota bacterium]